MRIPKALWIGIPAMFVLAAILVFLGPGPKPTPMIKIRLIAVKANRSNPDDVERARRKIEEIYEALENGESFRKLAKEKSEADSARQEGDMGWRGRGSLPPHHEDAVFYLEPGHYTEIIGDMTLEDVIYRILYVEERRNFK